MQRFVNDPLVDRPGAAGQRQVDFVCFTLPELLLEQFQGHAALGNQQNATGFAVKPVYQLQKLCFRSSHAQLLNDAKAHTTAPMHSDTRWLVYRQQKIVFKQHRKFGRRRIATDC